MKSIYPYKRKKKRIVAPLAAIFVAVAIVAYHFLTTLSPVIESISMEEVTAITANAVREAVSSVMVENDFEQPEIITYDAEGNIVSVQLNHNLINKIVQGVGLASQKKLAQLGVRGIDIPIGSLSGFVFLAGKGPSVNIKILPVGSISVQINSQFSEKGINQTNHRVYLRLNSDVNIVLPGSNNSISTLTEILICDTLIIGKVPSVYWGSTSDRYDFSPT